MENKSQHPTADLLLLFSVLREVNNQVSIVSATRGSALWNALYLGVITRHSTDPGHPAAGAWGRIMAVTATASPQRREAGVALSVAGAMVDATVPSGLATTSPCAAQKIIHTPNEAQVATLSVPGAGIINWSLWCISTEKHNTLRGSVLASPMSQRPISPLLRAWYKWKTLRLPWRRQFLVGASAHPLLFLRTHYQHHQHHCHCH